ncbi:hypothetical protein SPWS13_4132 [Shewanella putrefaciens]|nr:hypothetical protein SPWS13_4132 [Shewanella putrefaciens]
MTKISQTLFQKQIPFELFLITLLLYQANVLIYANLSV